MSVSFYDSLESYIQGSDLPQKWQDVGSAWDFNIVAGLNNHGAMFADGASVGSKIQTPDVMSVPYNGYFCCGFYFKISAPPSTKSLLWALYHSDRTSRCLTFCVNTTGVLYFGAYNNINTVLFTGVEDVCDNEWHYAEILGQISRSIFQGRPGRLWLDNAYDIYNGGQNIGGSSGWTGKSWGFSSLDGPTLSIMFPFCYWNDGSGLQTGNYPAGPLVGEAIRPSSDVLSQFSPGVDNYSYVNEVSGDRTGVLGKTSGLIDRYGYDNLAGSPTTIRAAATNCYVENPHTELGAKSYQAQAISGSTVGEGAARVAPATPFVGQDIFETNPDTAAAWTPLEIYSAEFGIKVV